MAPEPEVSVEEWLTEIDAQAKAFAELLSAASEAGVSHALILPRLMLAFRASFGQLPEGMTMPDLGAFT